LKKSAKEKAMLPVNFALAVIGIDHGRRLKAQTGRPERE
jgi:hypothetical protein